MRTITRAMVFVVVAMTAGMVQAQEIPYISSSSGYMLNASGGGAVTADWKGQAPIQGFTGYGQVKTNGSCLTGRDGQQQLRWESCKSGDKAQIWALSNGRLNNELGWCADVEGNRSGPGVRVLAWKCSGAINQQWSGAKTVSANDYLNKIQDRSVRDALSAKIRSANPGSRIQLTDKESSALIAAGGLNLMSKSSGSGSLIGLDGANLKVMQQR